MAYALDVLKLDGVVLFSNSLGIYLGDRRFAPLLEELQRRGAVVFIHPTASPNTAFHQLGLPDSLLDFPVDTALSWKDPVLQMLRSVVGIGQVLYGSDFPYLRRDLAVRSRAELGSISALTDAERTSVLGTNALRLFPRLSALRSQLGVYALG
jgi:hypothetical protein